MKILVVDDEPSIVDAVATALRYEGHDVIEAPNGLRAASTVRKGGIELVIIDVMLPDVHGTEVVRVFGPKEWISRSSSSPRWTQWTTRSQALEQVVTIM